MDVVRLTVSICWKCKNHENYHGQICCHILTFRQSWFSCVMASKCGIIMDGIKFIIWSSKKSKPQSRKRFSNGTKHGVNDCIQLSHSMMLQPGSYPSLEICELRAIVFWINLIWKKVVKTFTDYNRLAIRLFWNFSIHFIRWTIRFT